MPKLALHNLTKKFGDVTAVEDFNLELEEGEFVSLLGPSGCGKTTTLRMLAGFLPPNSGTIEMDGRLLSSPSTVIQPEHRRMSMIFQSYAIWPNMTVGENVAFGLRIRKVADAEVRRRVGELLEVVRMSQLLNRYPAELSGGQQQRVALARAIIVQPSVLLLDEPLSNLDANLREEMRYEIRRLHDEFQITTVYVTHDQAEAMVTSDRIAVMNQGRIEQVDPPYELYGRPRTRFVAGFIGRTNFLEGEVRGGEIAFEGFSMPLSRFRGLGSAGGRITFSLRPQYIDLYGERPSGADGACLLAGTIVLRGYMGEYWDYSVALESGGVHLRVMAPPTKVFETQQKIWLEVDPGNMVPIFG